MPFTHIDRGKIRIKLHQVGHELLAQRTMRIVRILNPARFAANSVEVLSTVAQSPTLPVPTSGRLSQSNFDFLQRTNWKLRLHGRPIVADVRWKAALVVDIEEGL